MSESEAVQSARGVRRLPRFPIRRVLGPLSWDRAIAIALIIPSTLAVGVFVCGFIGWSALVWVSRWDRLRPDYTFVGLHNFQELFKNFRFQADIRNMVVFTVLFIAACLVIGFLLATLL